MGVTGAFAFPWRSGGGGEPVLQGVSKVRDSGGPDIVVQHRCIKLSFHNRHTQPYIQTGVLHLMGSAASYTPSSSSDPAALIQRQDSTNSLAAAASSAIDMASVERESSAESALKGASASAILPLATLEELDLKPFFALAPSSPAVAGSDAPAAAGGFGGEIGTCAS